MNNNTFKEINESFTIKEAIDEAKRCLNCRFWTVSPLNATEGACWANGSNNLAATDASTLCPCGKFVMRANGR